MRRIQQQPINQPRHTVLNVYISQPAARCSVQSAVQPVPPVKPKGLFSALRAADSGLPVN
jgi:hypothetical protein